MKELIDILSEFCDENNIDPKNYIDNGKIDISELMANKEISLKTSATLLSDK